MFKLMRYYSIASLVSISVAAIGLTVLVSYRVPETVTRIGGTGNEEMARVLINLYGGSLRSMLALAPSRSIEQLRSEALSLQLSDVVRSTVKGTPIIKVRAFTSDGRTVFSSDSRQIGEEVGGKAGFIAALAGTVTTALTSQEHFGTSDQPQANRDVLSTYLPLRLGSSGQVDGVFEVYQDVTAFRHEIAVGLRTAAARALAVLLALFGVLYVIVLRADRAIEQQGKQRLTDAAALKTAHLALEKQVLELHATDARRERFLALSKLSADWFWDMDADFCYLGPDPQLDQYGAATSERRPGQKPWEVQDAELVNSTWDEHRADLEARRPFRDLLIRRSPPSGIMYVQASGAPVFAPDGSFSGYRGIASNVTARINAEQALADARTVLDKGIATKARVKFLQELLDELPVGVSLVDESFNFVVSNVASARLLGAPPEMVRPGASLEYLYRYNAKRGEFGPGDVEQIVKARMDLVRNRTQRNFERIRHDGTTLHVLSKALPDGSMLTVYTDVSDRKEKEKLQLESDREAMQQGVFLQELLDALPVGVALFDSNMNVLAANEASAGLQGLPLTLFKAGSSMVDVFRYHASRKTYGEGDVEALVEERVARAKTARPLLIEREFADGKTVEVRSINKPSVGRVVTYTDISEQKRAEREMVAAREAAEAGSKAKSSFLAVMSHEIRTPMNAVIGLLELLRLSKLDAEQRDTVDTVRESGKSLLRLIDDVLDFSKIESGKLELQLEPTSLTQMFDTAYQNFGAAASQKGILLMQNVDSRIAPALLLDPLRMRQIINNLLSNAIKFTKRGRVEMSVELLGQDAGQEQVRISVRDTGIGIQPGALARVFEPFSQADATIERSYGGTGLGLAICQRLAESMGSKIDVQSEPGVGTRIGLTLSLRRAYVKASNAPKPQAIDLIAETLQGISTPTVDDARARNELVLVVDDHPINRRMLARQLNALGYAVLTAADGREALALWQRGGFAVLITDCQMPVMDGYQLANAIRKLEAGMKTRLPIIACTANVSQESRQQCFSVGMDEVITKPVELATLKQLLDRWLPLEQAVKMDFPAAPLATDFGALEDLVMGDKAMRNELLDEFRRTNADDLRAAARAVHSVSIDDLRRSAHRIKGAARMVGSSRLADAAYELEKAAMAGDWQRVADAWPPMRQECERLDERIANQDQN